MPHLIMYIIMWSDTCSAKSSVLSSNSCGKWGQVADTCLFAQMASKPMDAINRKRRSWSFIFAMCDIDTHTQPLNGPWSGTTRVGRYQKKHSPTYTHPDHGAFFINFLHLLWSIASSVLSLRAWQSYLTTSLQVLLSICVYTVYRHMCDIDSHHI